MHTQPVPKSNHIENPIHEFQEDNIEDFRRARDEIHEKVKILFDDLGALEIKLDF